jgi:hypothetical protein
MMDNYGYVGFYNGQRVVDMWRENGYRCLQVAAWKE